MVEFKVRTQSASTGTVSNARTCQWAEMDQEFIKITINGSGRKNSLEIKIETPDRVYHCTDLLLLAVFERISEEFSRDYLTFTVEEK
jgi:hypothetical protein